MPQVDQFSAVARVVIGSASAILMSGVSERYISIFNRVSNPRARRPRRKDVEPKMGDHRPTDDGVPPPPSTGLMRARAVRRGSTVRRCPSLIAVSVPTLVLLGRVVALSLVGLGVDSHVVRSRRRFRSARFDHPVDLEYF